VLAHINADVEKAKKSVSDGKEDFNDRFGGVNCRGINGLFGYRQDFFLSMKDEVVLEGLREAITNMAPFLTAAVGEDAMIHELSCIVSDKGIHRSTSLLNLTRARYATFKFI
jgi:hypothetical protein